MLFRRFLPSRRVGHSTFNTAIVARTWDTTTGPGSSEENSLRRELHVSLAIDRTALIVIDPWATHPNEGWSKRLNASLPKLRQVIQLFRDSKRPIFYDSTGLPIHPMILEGAGPLDHFIEWDQMGGGTSILNKLLIQRGITTIFWAGYATNICLMSKPCGFRNIMPKDWDRLHFLVRDATIGMESGDTLAEERLWDAACYEIEYYPNGYTCTVSAIDDAFRQ